MATIGENDDDFLEQLIDFLEPNLKMLYNHHLVLLTETVFLFREQFNELFFVKIHNECTNRINKFTHEENMKLKWIFTESRKYLPSSPFIYPTLYYNIYL